MLTVTSASSFVTRYGVGWVRATDAGLYQLDFPSKEQGAVQSIECPSSTSSRAAELLAAYFNGCRVDFSDLPLDLSGFSPFFAKVLHTVSGIPYGSVCSYAEVASLCGSPRAARAVGAAMAANRLPIIIPCHRVVGAGGCLTGYSAPGGITTKKVLLGMEGVEFDGGHVKKKIVVMHR